MSRATRQRRCTTGEWERAHQRVYRSTAFPRSHDQRLLAAVLCAGPGAAVSHYAAAVAWGIDRFTTSLVEVSIADDRKVAIDGAQLHRIPDLVPEHITTIGPIPVTTRLRTLVDLGAVARPFLVSRALEQWLRERHVTVPQVRAILDEVARRGRGGAGVLRTRARHASATARRERFRAEVDARRGAPGPRRSAAGVPLPRQGRPRDVRDRLRVSRRDAPHRGRRLRTSHDSRGIRGRPSSPEPARRQGAT